jgi:hypothetical protein
MQQLAPIRRKLALACLALGLLAASSAVSASGALADETFYYAVAQPSQGGNSVSGLVDIIQGEGWSGESCIDEALEGGGYTEQVCHGKEVVEEQDPHNNGYARVWNAHGTAQLIWGWARF